jgi:hypothetical protein
VVGHEEGVELAALQRLGETFQVLETEVGIWETAGIAPRGGVDADRAHECTEMELASFGHGVPFVSRGTRWRMPGIFCHPASVHPRRSAVSIRPCRVLG